MRQLCNPTAVATRPAAATPSEPGWATTGSPGIQAATLIDADTFNSWQAEFIALLAAAALTPNPAVDNQILTAIQTLIAAQEAAVGDIKMTGCATAPTGWLMCTGAAVSRTVYANLFAAIGTAFGAGDGSTTFNIPNTENVFIVGAGGIYGLAGGGGLATQTTTIAGTALTTSQLPAHNHGINDPGHSHGVSDPGHSHGISDPGHLHSASSGQFMGLTSGAFGSNTGGSNVGQNPIGSNTANATTGISVNTATTGISVNTATTGISTQNAGAGATHTHTATNTTNLPPYLGLNFCIKY
jgi:microcystin-dependent protein